MGVGAVSNVAIEVFSPLNSYIKLPSGLCYTEQMRPASIFLLRLSVGLFSIGFTTLTSVGVFNQAMAQSSSLPTFANPDTMAQERCDGLSQASGFASQTTRILVDSANRQAEQKNYLPAICQYRLAVKRLPAEMTLANNLSVLYYNYAIQLQEGAATVETFAQSRQWLLLSQLGQEGKASYRTAQQAIAATYYDQAQTLRQHYSYNQQPVDWLTVRALLQQAKEADPIQAAYGDSLANSYVAEGIDLVKAGDIANGLPLVEKAHQLQPDSVSIQTSLAHVYLRQAQDTPQADQRKIWIDKAMAVSQNSPDVVEMARQMEEGHRVRSSDTDGSGHDAGYVAMPITEQIAALEVALGLPDNRSRSIPSRLKVIEKQVYGKVQKGALNQRVETAYGQILGRGQTFRSSAPDLIQQTIQTSEGTYLSQVFKATGGRVIRWAKFPLDVAINAPEEGLEQYLSTQGLDLTNVQVQHALQDGFNRWIGATGEFVSVNWVLSTDNADVVIEFKPSVDDRFAQAGYVVLEDFVVPKRSKLQRALGVASMFAPGAYGLAPQAVAAGIQYRQYQHIKSLKDESTIPLSLDRLQGVPSHIALTRLANMAAYELGHVLGIKANSPNPADLMHPSTVIDTLPRQLSAADLATFKALYERPANIVLNLD